MAVISDAAAYFVAVKEAVFQARHCVFMLGWDFDTRILLSPERDGEEAPNELGDFLKHVVDTREDLNIYILRWDLAVLKMPFRGRTPLMLLDWMTSRRLHFRLDGKHPPAACHHQKIVVIDDAIAFCGGIDLTSDRWDTPEHRDEHPGRVRPSGSPYPPWHDATTIVEGEAARSLGDLARRRWAMVTGNTIPPANRSGCPPWPKSVTADFQRVDVGIARTDPGSDQNKPVREIEKLYLRAIASAKHTIYIETQYFASSSIADALIEALEKEDGPEIVLINPETSQGWLEEAAMGSARAILLRGLAERDKRGRFRCFWSATAGGKPIYVHAKILVIDDTLLRVGSSNVNNRSMGLDTECDVAVEASTPEERRKIQDVRDRFLAEHLGVDVKEVSANMDSGKGILKTIECLSSGSGRRLIPLDPGEVSEAEIEIFESNLLDPGTPEQMSNAFKRGRWPLPALFKKLIGL